MKDVLLQLIGNYVSDTSVSGLASVDWPWLASAALLIVCIYSVFRLIGLMIVNSCKR